MKSIQFSIQSVLTILAMSQLAPTEARAQVYTVTPKANERTFEHDPEDFGMNEFYYGEVTGDYWYKLAFIRLPRENAWDSLYLKAAMTMTLGIHTPRLRQLVFGTSGTPREASGDVHFASSPGFMQVYATSFDALRPNVFKAVPGASSVLIYRASLISIEKMNQRIAIVDHRAASQARIFILTNGSTSPNEVARSCVSKLLSVANGTAGGKVVKISSARALTPASDGSYYIAQADLRCSLQ